jgi:hypothetical protein
MRAQPNPDWDRVAGWLDGSNPRATRRVSWVAVGALAVAVVWSVATPDSTPRRLHDDRAGVVAAAAATPAVPRAAACWPESGRPEPRPAGLSAVSTGRVQPGGVVESTRWGTAGRRGLWGVAAVADCNTVRLDAVWFEPSGRKHRHRIGGSGLSATGVVANGLDGAIAAYSVRTDRLGRLDALLHISTDWGVTWEQRQVPRSAEPDVRAGVLSPDWTRWPVLRS